jgi:diguanylate cyclase (GGDEF)-like protein
MVIPLYGLFLVILIGAHLVLANANIGVFAVSVLDLILFGLAGRDLLLNFRGHGRAHLLQGIGLVLFALLITIWGTGFLFLPPTPVIAIQYGDGLMIGLAGNCFAAAFGATNFLLMCNDEFNTRLQTLVATDSLTGIANRRQLMERGEAEMARARRYNQPLTVVMIDLDYFKKLNDTFGHAAGDQALRQAAQVCEAALRDIDLISRSGGEEFVALLPQTPMAQGQEVAERLRTAIAAIDLVWGGDKIPLTASLGVAELRFGDASIDQVLARADQALYRSKADGRNRVSCEMPESPELSASSVPSEPARAANSAS